MRFSLPAVVSTVCMLLTAAAPLWSQGKTPSTESPPEKIGGKTLEQWIADLKDRDPSVVETAIQTVLLYGSHARKAAPELTACLQHTDASVRVYAAIAIGIIPIEDKDVAKAVEALTKRLSIETQVIARFHVVMALGQFGTDAQPAIPGLLNAAQDTTSWEVRKAAVFALGRAAAGNNGKPPDQRAYPVLVGRLNVSTDRYETSHQVRLEAAIAISLLGPPIDPNELKKVIFVLQQRVGDKNEDDQVKIWAHMAWMSMKKTIDEPTVVEIGKYLHSKKLLTRVQAARALGEIGVEAKSRIDDLITLLKDEEPLAVIAACWALSEMGDLAKKASEPLNQLMEKHKDEGVRKAAKEALTKVLAKPKK